MRQAALTPVAMIAAMDRNRAIGVNNRMPWHIPEDLGFFKRMTMGKPVVMGRKTFQSIGRPLPGRLNIVVTRDPDFRYDGIRICHDMVTALTLASQQAVNDGVEEVMVIGGAEIYAQALTYANRLYLTELRAEVEGDAHFPEIDPSEWMEVRRKAGSPSSNHPAYDFVKYRRVGGRIIQGND